MRALRTSESSAWRDDWKRVLGDAFSLERGAQVGDWVVAGGRMRNSVVSTCQQEARLNGEQDLRISIDLLC